MLYLANMMEKGLLISYSAMLLACESLVCKFGRTKLNVWIGGSLYLGHHIWDIPKANFIYGHKVCSS